MEIRVVSVGTETLVLAEDDESIRELAKLALESRGFTVLAARNGDEALRLCQQHPTAIHLLVTDVVMPQMSGRQLADSVRALHPNLKVLFPVRIYGRCNHSARRSRIRDAVPTEAIHADGFEPESTRGSGQLRPEVPFCRHGPRRELT